MGWIEGGYQAMVDLLAERIRELGGEVHTSTPVHHIPATRGRAIGVVHDTGFRHHDHVVTTQLRPHVEKLLVGELRTQLAPDPNRYLGIVCLVARVKKSVSPYYALNITDRRVPITSVVETTHVVDPDKVGGHVIYVPRYVNSDSPELDRPSEDITDEYLGHVQTLFPDFSREDVIATQVARTRMAEPIHVASAHPHSPELFPAPGLVMASSAHVHPHIVHGQAIAEVAERVSTELLERLNTTTPLARVA
jgi:protoporphyrinogen oxidase